MLLDALTALEGHLDNLVLVGAQAVYHHAGDADLNVPLMTTDGDLAINTHDLAGMPEIGAVLRQAGFAPGPNPGHWVSASEVAVDLMVVPHQAGTTKASARAARQAMDTPDLVRGFAIHREDKHAAAVTAEALEIYRIHAVTPQGRIAQLATSAAQGDPTIAPAFAALVTDLLSAL